MIIAMIGSRDLNELQKGICYTLGQWATKNGHHVRSGNALGADQAYAQGVNSVDPSKLTVCLPWSKYERQAIVSGNQVVSYDELIQEHQEILELIARQHHPAWDRLTQGPRKLHARNGLILITQLPTVEEVLPHDGQRVTVAQLHVVDLVLAWLNHSKPGGGGTGQACRVAADAGIEVVDLSQLDKAGFQALGERLRV